MTTTTAPTDQIHPETHWISPTPHVPNSKLPILIYRGALSGYSPEEMLHAMESNDWLKGGQWKTYKVAHFHTNVHEAYAVISGKTTYQLGKSPSDPDYDAQGREHGLVLSVEEGDAFVFPAGVSHKSLESEGDYEYIGFYPRDPSGGKAKFDMNYGLQHEAETAELAAKCNQVPIPTLDPLYGHDGPLPRLWREVLEKSYLREGIPHLD